jgi:hypothetical protein
LCSALSNLSRIIFLSQLLGPFLSATLQRIELIYKYPRGNFESISLLHCNSVLTYVD